MFKTARHFKMMALTAAATFAVFAVLGLTPAEVRQIDHGQLWGRFDDDHPQYLREDGTRPLAGDWDAGDFDITMDGLNVSGRIVSTWSGMSPPIDLTSTNLNTNLNADLWDGYQFSDYLDQAVKQVSSVTFAAVDANTLQLSGGMITDTTGQIDFEDTDWIGVGSIAAGDFTSVVATGTAPFYCDSTTVCTNLNADQVDGYEAADLAKLNEHVSFLSVTALAYKSGDLTGVASVVLTFPEGAVGDCNSITVSDGLIVGYTVVE